MKKLLSSSLIAATLLSGCGGAPTRQAAPLISESEAMEGFNALQADAANIKAKKQKTLNEYKTIWVQPQNKQEACKVFFGSKDGILPPNYKIYWDGGCKDGYAYGLGREFEKAYMHDREALAEYGGGSVKPKYYMKVDKLIHSVILGDLNGFKLEQQKLDKKDNEVYIRTIIHNDDISGTGLLYRTTKISDNNEFIQYQKGESLSVAPVCDISEYTNAPNGLELDIKTAYKGKMLQIIRLDDGSIFHINKTENKKVTFPEIYIKSVSSYYDEIKSKTNEALPFINLAKNKKQYYKSLVCKDSVNVDFMPSSEYKAICSEYEYFTPFMADVKETTKKAYENASKVRAELQNQKAQQADLEYRKLSLELQRRQAEAAEEANNPLSMQNRLRSLQDMNNRNKPVNCSKVGGVVTCF